MRLQMRLRSLAGPSQTHDRPDVLPGQRWRRMRDSNSRGVAPTRFPTMLASVHRCPPPSVTCPNTTTAAACERCRTGVNETETETERQAALYGAARLRS